MKKLLLLLMFVVLMSVSVFAQGGALRFGMVNQDPDPVRAGDIVEVRFKVENLWDETRYDVEVEFVPEYPFTLYGETATKNLGRVDGREIVYFDYKLKVDAGASDGDHEIKLRVMDGDQGIWELRDMFFVDVDHERIEVKPYIVSSNLMTGGKSGSFTIEMANIGGVNVEALQLELQPSEDYTLLSTSNYVYIGNLEFDDTESEDFTIYVEEDVTDVHIPIRLQYEYQDEQYSKEDELVLRLLTQEQAKKLGLVQSSNAPYIIGAIVVIVIAIWVIRRYRRR